MTPVALTLTNVSLIRAKTMARVPIELTVIIARVPRDLQDASAKLMWMNASPSRAQITLLALTEQQCTSASV